MFALILLYLILTVIRPQDYMPALAQFPLMPAALILAFLGWLVSSEKDFGTPQILLLPTFLLAMMVSQLAAGWAGGALLQAEKFGPSVLAFLVLATAVSSSRQRVRSAMIVLTLCAFVLAVHGVDQAINGVGWTGVGTSENGRIQYVGIFHDPNDLGMLFVTVLPMAVYLSAGGGIMRRLFWLAGAALLVYGIHLTKSRGTMLALLVVMGAYLWYRRGLIMAALAGIVGLGVMEALGSRMQNLSVDESSAAGRIDAWYEGLYMFREHPVFGVGAGNFTDYNYLTAHNSFVLVLAETGIVGFTLWIAFVGYSFWMMLILVRSHPETGAAGADANGLELMPHAGAPQQTPQSRQGPADDAATDMHIAGFTGMDSAGGDDPLATRAATAANADDHDWHEERRLGLALLLSLCGMFAAAFFLSRSYTVLIYLVIAIVVGEYIGARRRFPDLPSFSLSEGWWRWIPVAVGSVVALYLAVKILLALQ